MKNFQNKAKIIKVSKNIRSILFAGLVLWMVAIPGFLAALLIPLIVLPKEKMHPPMMVDCALAVSGTVLRDRKSIFRTRDGLGEQRFICGSDSHFCLMAVEGSAGTAGGTGIDRLTKQLFKFMIANDTSPKVNVRLNRIKIISWALKILLLLFFLFFGFGRVPFARKTPDGFWEVVFGTYTTFSDAPLVAKLIVGLGISMVLAAI